MSAIDSKAFSMSDLPQELIPVIMSYLSPLESSAAGVVDSLWNQSVRNPSLWPKSLDELNCRVIDEPVWWEHAALMVKIGDLSFEGTRTIAKNDIVAIMKVTKLYARLKDEYISIERNLGLTILTIPQGISINLIAYMFKDRIAEIKPKILESLGAEKVQEAYQVIISNGVLENTRERGIEFHGDLLGDAGCRLPKVKEAMMLALLTEKCTSGGTRLFNDNPATYTRCIEGVDMSWLYEWREADSSVTVGYFSPRGLDVGISIADTFTQGTALSKSF